MTASWPLRQPAGAEVDPNVTRDPGPNTPVDAVCFGETMASFVATDDPDRYRVIAAGAESNVAIGMARLGCSTRWVSRLGEDPLGRFVEESVVSAGVEASVVRDGGHPTGVMVKHPAGAGKVSSYYRSQSAARLLGPEDRKRFGRARWIHASGITPALSTSAAALVEAVLEDPSPIGDSVSFDVNHRPVLWTDDRDAASVIVPLARRADLVFIGDDEAEALLGRADPSSVAEALVDDASDVVVLKHGERGATAITAQGQVFVRAMPVRAVDVTGAGDAFAAGFLAGACFGWPTEAQLRLGHFLAARVVRQTDDALGPIPDREREMISPETLATSWSSMEAGDEPRGPDDGPAPREGGLDR